MAMNLEEALKYILTDSMDKFRIGRIRGGQTVFKLSLPSFPGKLFGAGQ